MSLRASDVQHTIEKLSTRAKNLLETSLQYEIYTQSYAPPKLRKSQFWEFRDSHLGISRQNAIWMLAPWPGTKDFIREKVVASPKFGP
jgi:hypothetical protein